MPVAPTTAIRGERGRADDITIARFVICRMTSSKHSKKWHVSYYTSFKSESGDQILRRSRRLIREVLNSKELHCAAAEMITNLRFNGCDWPEA